MPLKPWWIRTNKRESNSAAPESLVSSALDDSAEGSCEAVFPTFPDPVREAFDSQMRALQLQLETTRQAELKATRCARALANAAGLARSFIHSAPGLPVGHDALEALAVEAVRALYAIEADAGRSSAETIESAGAVVWARHRCHALAHVLPTETSTLTHSRL